MTKPIYGGVNIAMKVPAHQYDETVRFYRDTIGLEPVDKPPHIGFHLGPHQLWIDRSEALSQAEVWLEFFTDDFAAAARHLEQAHVVRCDAIEPLGPDFRGGWISSPAQIIHMVREPDAW